MFERFAPLVLTTMLIACKDQQPKREPPPPPAETPKAGTCSAGGGEVRDPISAPFFPRAAASYCLDPDAQAKTYGENAKFTMDDVCTTAFDGECEVYKRFELRRVVAVRYIDGAGTGGSVDVVLSHFANDDGAYGMFTQRVVAGDPADPSTPKPLAVAAAGAIGTGRAYVWRGTYLAELQYNNEQETPEQLVKSSQVILSELAKGVGDRLPGAATLPEAARLLPEGDRIPSGLLYQEKGVLGPGMGSFVYGFYRSQDERWRGLSMVGSDEARATETMKTLRAKAGATPIANLGDEAVWGTLSPNGSRTRIPFAIARKGRWIVGIGAEEYAAPPAGGERSLMSREEAVAKVRNILSTPPLH